MHKDEEGDLAEEVSEVIQTSFSSLTLSDASQSEAAGD